MRRSLMDILCCPVCKGDLVLVVKSEDEKEILEGDKEKDAETLVGMIRNSSVIEECYQVVQSFCTRACSALEQLPSNSVHNSLTGLAAYVSERKS